MVRTAPPVDPRDFSGSAFYQRSKSIVFDLVKMALCQCDRRRTHWPELKLENLNWDLAFTQINKTCKETKLREINYKLLHRTIVTKKELKRTTIIFYSNKANAILHVKFLSHSLTKLFHGSIIQIIWSFYRQ